VPTPSPVASSSNVRPTSTPGPAAATYVASNAVIANPERGFMAAFTSPLTTANTAAARQQGLTVAHLDIDLSAFRASPLSAALLGQVSQDFAVARSGGIKLVPRFAYDFTSAGQDAPLPLVLQHISQLRPWLVANSDVILYLDAGFIGAWGEWHNSANDLITHQVGAAELVNSATRQIMSALLNALPSNRMVLVRTQRYKYELTGTGNLTSGAAYSASAQARIGFHNDCFLADSTDDGTYLVRATDEQWLARETRYVPISGETCADDASAAPYVTCANALHEMALLHWNTLRSDYDPAVVAQWKTNGCWTQAVDRLGYRFSLLKASATHTVAPGGPLTLSLGVENSGFAALVNLRPVQLVLRNLGTGTSSTVALNVDPRRWPAGVTTAITTTVTLPNSLAAGRYDLLLALPDQATSLRSNFSYSIQMANVGTWNAATGANDLKLTLTVA
jgi:hypothetical protein